jgi:hypothetical protein
MHFMFFCIEFILRTWKVKRIEINYVILYSVMIVKRHAMKLKENFME